MNADAECVLDVCCCCIGSGAVNADAECVVDVCCCCVCKC